MISKSVFGEGVGSFGLFPSLFGSDGFLMGFFVVVVLEVVVVVVVGSVVVVVVEVVVVLVLAAAAVVVVVGAFDEEVVSLVVVGISTGFDLGVVGGVDLLVLVFISFEDLEVAVVAFGGNVLGVAGNVNGDDVVLGFSLDVSVVGKVRLGIISGTAVEGYTGEENSTDSVHTGDTWK